MGVRSRKIMTIAAAVFAVALMLAVPVAFAVGSDAAEIGKDEAGYKIVATNPSNEDLAEYTVFGVHNSMVPYAMESCSVFTSIFDLGVLVPTFDAKEYGIVNAKGLKINSETYTDIEDDEFSAKEIELIYTFDADGDLVDSFIANSEYEPAANAIKAYFNNATVKAGDKLKITGTVNTKVASQTTNDFAAVDSDHSVVKGGSAQGYFVNDIDVTIEFIKDGSSAGKVFYRADDKYMIEFSFTCDFGSVQYKDITPATPCTVKYGLATFSFENGSARYTVDGTEYKIGHTWMSEEIHGYANVKSNSDWNLNSFREDLNSVPASTADGKVTIDRTIDAAQSAYGDVVANVVGDDLLKLILIIVGVVIGIIVLLIVLIIVVVVLLKKKKKQ